MERSDAELVAAACQGDVDCFRQLYERHYWLAIGIARSRLRDLHLAEDAAQEAFAVACRQLATLRDGRRFAEWLGTICRRTARKAAKVKVNHAPLSDTAATSESTDDSGKVRAALDTLSPASREIVMLHYFSGLSHEQIAQSLGVSAAAVHGRLQRARRDLARDLGTSEE